MAKPQMPSFFFETIEENWSVHHTHWEKKSEKKNKKKIYKK